MAKKAIAIVHAKIVNEGFEAMARRVYGEQDLEIFKLDEDTFMKGFAAIPRRLNAIILNYDRLGGNFPELLLVAIQHSSEAKLIVVYEGMSEAVHASLAGHVDHILRLRDIGELFEDFLEEALKKRQMSPAY